MNVSCAVNARGHFPGRLAAAAPGRVFAGLTLTTESGTEALVPATMTTGGTASAFLQTNRTDSEAAPKALGGLHLRLAGRPRRCLFKIDQLVPYKEGHLQSSRELRASAATTTPKALP